MKSCHCLLLLALLPLVGCGMTAPRGNAGYAELDSLGFRDVDQTMTLSLGPAVLRLAAASIEGDPETRTLVGQLDGVRIRTYDVPGEAERVAERIDRMSRKLQQQGWVPVLWVREPGERTVVLMKLREDHIAGLTLLNSDAQEAVVVNVMGELRPEMFSGSISGSMAALNVEGLPSAVAGAP